MTADRTLPALALAFAACSGVDPLDVPADPAAPGAPVGVRTVTVEGRTLEVWYPAPSDTEVAEEEIRLEPFLPERFLEVASDLVLPRLSAPVARDAPVRDGGEPWPVVVFSHGFGGFRQQSVDLTTHLASRGYVVVSADHPSRWLGGLVPCLLTSTTEDCSLSFDTSSDPAVDDATVALDWITGAPEPFTDRVDGDVVGVFGHSAGGGTTAALANADARVDAALPMGGSGSFEVDLPSAVLGGSCDGIVPEAGEGGLAEAGLTSTGGYWSVAGAGHLAFSDLCELDLGAVGDQIAQRDDANTFLLDGLVQLGTDGCPGATPAEGLPTCTGGGFLDLDVSTPMLRWLVAAFFDEHLKGTGPGLAAADFPELSRLETVPATPDDEGG